YWECYDIRTGEVYWERPLYAGETVPNLIEWGTGTLEVDGGMTKPSSPTLLSISNGYLRRYNPFTGVMTANVSIAPMTGNGGTYYMNGYVLGIQDLGADAGSERYRLINWTTRGTSANFATRVMSNTTYARSALPTAQLIDWNVGIGCTVASISEGGVLVGMNMTAFDLLTGIQLWNKYINEAQYSGVANVADHGKLAVLSANGYYLAFDLRTGNEVWRTRQLDYPWDSSGFGSYSVTTAYGQLYWMAQTGIYAIDWNTGAINWKFEKESPPFETPYIGSNGQPVYPLLNAGLCADGKIYAYSNQHTPEQPYYRGQPTICIDVFTGKEVWSVGITGGSDMRRTEVQLAVADGYLTAAGRDGYLYCYGKGQSETTISASQVPLTLGQKALITGTVLDLSPAQPGAPCVSKESVAAQMEQYHIGASVGGVFSGVMMYDGSYGDVMMVGVPVSLDVLDPNGNHYNIGTVISDGYSGVFGYSDWVPKVAGQYTITATFMGDESYGSSFATTYLVVAEGAEGASSDNTLLYALIGATVAIIVVMIACFIIFRKK
ncbi:MAG: PQQ-binding-like beta-propeller repeat protein, partial [Candidatus Bathyarchaeota archaeon]|nr:PQQ-binding-like beta-propeller repeat protein [Candidatus Termiticorpusculum sp.]